MRKIGWTLAVAAATACVFPVQRVSGIELSWRFLETNAIDGEEAQRFRTCDGARATQIEVTITDEDDEERHRVFPYDCTTGFQTVAEFQARASDVFIDLDRGSYDVLIEAVDADGDTILTDRVSLPVEARGVTVHGWPLAVPAIPWTMQLVGTESCDQVTLRLRYTDPSQTLADPAAEADTGEDGDTGSDLDITYRDGLVSNKGLSLGGATMHDCSDLEPGDHMFGEIDEGEYTLDVNLDGAMCSVAVTVRGTDPVQRVDLANLGCAG